MAIRAAGTLFAVAKLAERPTYWRSWRHFHVSILAVRLHAVVLEEMQASRRSFWAEIMGKIASRAA